MLEKMYEKLGMTFVERKPKPLIGPTHPGFQPISLPGFLAKNHPKVVPVTDPPKKTKVSQNVSHFRFMVDGLYINLIKS